MIGRRIGSVRVESQLGSGGMGEVFLGRDERLDRLVAIKVLHSKYEHNSEARERLEREARALSRLDHPNICRIYGIEDDPTNGATCLLLEYIEGRRLTEVLEENPSSERRSLFARQLAEALRAAHEARVLHRDLKPDNVLVDRQDRVKVLDFGLSRSLDQPQPDSERLPVEPTTAAATVDTPPETTWLGGRLPAETAPGRADSGVTQLGALLGTALYMSPEQARGEKVGAPSDVFSLGLVLREVLLASPGYARDLRQHELMERVREGRTEPLPVSTPGLRRLLQEMTSPSPEDRPSAEEVLSAADLTQNRSPFSSKLLWSLAAIATTMIVTIVWRVAVHRNQPDLLAADLLAGGRIATLPFTSPPDPQAQTLATELTAELSQLTVKLRGFESVAPASAASIADQQLSLETINERLQIDYLLRGSVAPRAGDGRGRGDRYLVQSELVDTATGTMLWQHQLSGQASNLLDLSRRLGLALQQELQLETSDPSNQPATSHLAANRAFRRAVELFRLSSFQELEKARGLLERAVELDPQFGPAWAWLVRVNARMHWGFPNEIADGAERAEQALVRARQTCRDRELLETVEGYFQYHVLNQRDLALRHFERAPGHPDARQGIAFIRRRNGESDRARLLLEESLLLDPFNVRLLSNLALSAQSQRDFTGAIGYLDRAIALAPDDTALYGNRAYYLLLWHGDTSEARDALREGPDQAELTPWWNLLDWVDRDFESILERLQNTPDELRSLVLPPDYKRDLFRLWVENRLRPGNSRDEAAKLCAEYGEQTQLDLYSAFPRVLQAYACLLAGDATQAVAAAREAVARVEDDHFIRAGFEQELAVIYAWAGEKMQSLDLIESIVAQVSDPPLTRAMLRIDPWWDPLRAEPRFAALVD